MHARGAPSCSGDSSRCRLIAGRWRLWQRGGPRRHSPVDLALGPACMAGDPGSIPGQGTRSHMPQLKIPHAVMKIEDPACFN